MSPGIYPYLYPPFDSTIGAVDLSGEIRILQGRYVSGDLLLDGILLEGDAQVTGHDILMLEGIAQVSGLDTLALEGAY